MSIRSLNLECNISDKAIESGTFLSASTEFNVTTPPSSGGDITAARLQVSFFDSSDRFMCAYEGKSVIVDTEETSPSFISLTDSTEIHYIKLERLPIPNISWTKGNITSLLDEYGFVNLKTQADIATEFQRTDTGVVFSGGTTATFSTVIASSLKEGEQVTISGTTSNNTTYTISTIDTGTGVVTFTASTTSETSDVTIDLIDRYITTFNGPDSSTFSNIASGISVDLIWDAIPIGDVVETRNTMLNRGQVVAPYAPPPSYGGGTILNSISLKGSRAYFVDGLDGNITPTSLVVTATLSGVLEVGDLTFTTDPVGRGSVSGNTITFNNTTDLVGLPDNVLTIVATNNGYSDTFYLNVIEEPINEKFVSIYRLNSNTISDTAGTYADPTAGNTSWSTIVPEAASNGDIVYVSTRSFFSDGTFSGNWTTPTIFYTRADGQAIRAVNIYKINDSSITDDTQGTFADPLSGMEAGWSLSVPSLTADGDQVYVSTRTFTNDTLSPQDATWSTPSIYSERVDGTTVNGQSARTVLLFNLNDSSIPNTTDGTFATPLSAGFISDGWDYDIPALTTDGDEVYVTVRTFTSDGLSPQDANWTTPTLYATRIDGNVGTAGQSARTVFLFNLNDGSIPNTTDGTFADPLSTAFSTDGWGYSVPSITTDGDQVFVTSRTFTSDGLSPQDANWPSPTVYSERVDGQTGQAIRNVNIYSLNDSNITDDTQGTFSNPLSGVEAGWSLSVPSLSVDGDIVYSSTRTFTDDAQTPQDASWSTPTIYARRVDGTTVNGQAVRSVNVYKLNDSTIGNNTAGTFADPLNGLEAGWALSVPSLTVDGDIVYVSTRTLTDDALSPQDATWSTPTIYAQRTDGDVGTGGQSVRTVNAYKLNDATIGNNTAGTFADPLNGVEAGWTLSVPSLASDGDIVYVSTRTFTDDTLSPQDANWSTPTIYAQRTDGTTPQAIRNVNIYKLNDSNITDDTQGTFSNPLSGMEAGWSLSVPSLTADGDIVYSSTRTFTDDAASPQDASWSTPTIYSQRVDGNDIIGQAVRSVNIYKLNDSNITDDTQGTFANPLNGLEAGWTLSVPSLTTDGDLVYVATRTFTDDALSPQDATWSTPTIYAQRTDGGTGTAGQSVRTVNVYKLNDSTIGNNTAGTFADPTNGLEAGWTLNVPSLAADEDIVYVSTRTFTDDTLSPQDATWSTPTIYAQRTDGGTGGQGDRGPGRFYTSIAGASAVWSDSVADAACTGGQEVVGDVVVTEYPDRTTVPFVETRECTVVGNPGTWIGFSVVIDGSLLVDGTVAADALNVDQLSAITANMGDITAGSITGGTIQTSDQTDEVRAVMTSAAGTEPFVLYDASNNKNFYITSAGSVFMAGGLAPGTVSFDMLTPALQADIETGVASGGSEATGGTESITPGNYTVSTSAATNRTNDTNLITTAVIPVAASQGNIDFTFEFFDSYWLSVGVNSATATHVNDSITELTVDEPTDDFGTSTWNFIVEAATDLAFTTPITVGNASFNSSIASSSNYYIAHPASFTETVNITATTGTLAADDYYFRIIPELTSGNSSANTTWTNFNNSNLQKTAAEIRSFTVSVPLSSTGSFTQLSGLTDTDTTGVTTGDILVYDIGGDWTATDTITGDLTIAQNGATTVTLGQVNTGDSTDVLLGKGFDAASSIQFRRGALTDASIRCDAAENLLITYSEDGTSSILAIYNDATEVARWDTNGDLDLNSNDLIDVGNVSSTTVTATGLISTSGNNISVSGASPRLTLEETAEPDWNLLVDGGNFRIGYNGTGNAPHAFQGTANGTDVTSVTLAGSVGVTTAGVVTGVTNIDVADSIRHTGNTATSMDFTTDTITFEISNTDKFVIGGSSIQTKTLLETQVSNFLKHTAPDIETGNTTAHTLTWAWTAGNDRTYCYPTNDGTNQFSREMGYNFTTGTVGEWYIEGSPVMTGANITGVATADAWTTGRTITLSGDVSGTSPSWDGSGNLAFTNTVVANDSHTHTFDNLTSKGSGTGDYSTNGNIESGRASGGVALTINDGQGNANVTFNHADGVAEQAGNIARIVVNTDSTSGAQMDFEVNDNAAAGAVTSTIRASITQTYMDLVNLDLRMGDSQDVSFGDGRDVDMFWDGLNLYMDFQTSDANLFIRDIANVTQFNFDTANGHGTATDWIATSDARLKKNIKHVSTSDCLDTILNLQPVTHEWIEGKEGRYNAFIAQQVEQIDPSLVTENDEGIKAVSYMKAVPILTGAIQELYVLNDEKDKKIAKLEAKIDMILEKLK